MLNVVSKLGEEIEDFLNSIRGLGVGGELNKRLNHWSINVEFSKMGQRLYFFSDFFNFTFKLDPASTHLKIVNNSEGLSKGVDSLLVLSLAHSVISGLLSSESGTFLDSVGQESDVLNGSSELRLGIGKETLGVDDGLLTLSLGSGVGVSLVGGVGDFSLTDNQIFVMLRISGLLFGILLSDEFVDKGNNIINNTFGSEVNL